MEMVKGKQIKDKYPAYKYSGVEWLEYVPAHWELKKIKRIFVEKKYSTNVDLNCGSISFGKVVLKDDEKIPLSTKKSYQVLSKGEFLVNPLNLNYDLISLRIALSELDVVVSSGYIILKNVIEINKTYFKWLLHRFDVAYMKLLGSGVRQTLNYNDIGECDLVFPPLSEQEAIASFLDRKTALIDQAINIKEKQIELLKERRQILIQKAVTRGLKPNVKMKDSGVKWIGEIPEHWDVQSFKNILVERNIKNDPIKSKERLSLSIDKGVTLYSEKTTNLDRFKEDFTQYKLAYKDDLVFNSMNMIVGAVGVSNYFGCVSPVYYTYCSRLGNPKITKYYEYFFKSRIVQAQLFCLGKGIMAIDRGDGKFNTIRLKVSRNDLRSMNVLFPGLSEITEIVDYIERKNSDTDKVIKLQEQVIEKLKEYKATLINSVVTGKIKVS